MTEFAREYGEGLYELAFEEKLTQNISLELKCLKEAFEEQPDFTKLLSNRALGLNERLGIIEETFRGRINDYLINFLKLLCSRDAIHEFGRCVLIFEERFNSDNRISKAVVTTAKPLTNDHKEQLQRKLEKLSGHEVFLTERIDETVIGGVILEMDGQRWDNTIKQRLEAIRKDISGE